MRKQLILPIIIWSAGALFVAFGLFTNSGFVGIVLGRLAAAATEPLLIISALVAGLASVVWWRFLILETLVAAGMSIFLHIHNAEWWRSIGYTPDSFELTLRYFLVALLIGSISFSVRTQLVSTKQALNER